MSSHLDRCNPASSCGVECGVRVGREVNRLSARTVQTIADPGRHGDGDGLYLVVDKDGGKRWVLLFQLRGRRREMGLGAVKDRSLAQARQEAQDARELIRQGKDPIEARKSPSGVPTFAKAAETLIADLAPGWRGVNTESGWKRSLLTHAEKLGPKPIDTVTTEDIMAVVKPMWTKMPESGGKLRERIETLMDAAKARGWRSGENPARWRGHMQHMLPKRQKLTRGHFKAMPYADAPAFVQMLQTRGGMGARALEWIILTAAREGMARLAVWSEIKGDLWIIPAKRMKDGREHRVPLSPSALALLERMRAGRKVDPKGYIFPGAKTGSAISNMTSDKVLRGLKLDYTVHGFRSTFRDWAGDCTEHPREVVEAALAHAVGDAVERAYRRGDALEKRRRLMADWDAYLSKPSPGAG